MEVITKSELETAALAQTLAQELKSGDIIALHGTLGMGKSVFSRALIRALCEDSTLEVPSPTFTLVQTYDSALGPISHFDLYRLENPEEIYELGWEEATSTGIALIEWPQRLGTLLPHRRLDIRLQAIDNEPDHRVIQIVRVG